MRLIVSDVDKAVEVLREKNFAVMSTDVVCLSCANVPGSLAVVLEYLAEEQIFIEYMYAFAQADQAHVVIKPNDMSQCLKVLRHIIVMCWQKKNCKFYMQIPPSRF